MLQHLLRLLADPRGRARWFAGYLRGARMFGAARGGLLVNVQGRVLVDARGSIVFGGRVVFLDGLIPSRIVCLPGAELLIGAGTGFNYGVNIECTRSIRIGERCTIASMVSFIDDAGGGAAPIVVGDDAWIAHGVTILPGVKVGARSVISAGSVVMQDVPSDNLAMGNPARCVSLALIASRPESGRMSDRVGSPAARRESQGRS
jgi:maltose O-acetyltransferase